MGNLNCAQYIVGWKARVSSSKKGRRQEMASEKTKSRNLLERLKDYKNDTLRFMKYPDVPYSNNLSEEDIRVEKIHQNIRKCFRNHKEQ